MKKLLKTLIPSLIVGVLAVAYAHSQGMLVGYPIVGGAAYCSSYVNAVCVNTVVAGPTVITGNENIAGDTNLASGLNPQVVKFSMASLNLLPNAYSAITNGSAFYTYTFDNTTGRVTFTSSGAISDERVTAPPAPVDGQRACVNSINTITAFQFIANSGQLLAATTPTVLTASTTVPQGYCWVYRTSNTTWYRSQ